MRKVLEDIVQQWSSMYTYKLIFMNQKNLHKKKKKKEKNYVRNLKKHKV
jgi:hypothetical protein